MQELKDELEARKLDTSGLKAALVERLEAAIGAEEAGEPAGAAEDADGAAASAEPAGETGTAGAGDDAAGKPVEQVSRCTRQAEGWTTQSLCIGMHMRQGQHGL